MLSFISKFKILNVIMLNVVMLNVVMLNVVMLNVVAPSQTSKLNVFNVPKIVTNIRKDCFQNKSKFITEDQFTKHMNITIH